MAANSTLKRINVYVNPGDLERVAKELGCRPSDAVRRLIDNFLLAVEIEEIRRMPGPAPEQVFRTGESYRMPKIPDDVKIEPVE